MGVESKAKMLLTTKRVTIVAVKPTYIFARVQGSKPDPYRTTVFKNGKWDCECEYFQKGITDGNLRAWECSHALAVKLSPIYKEWVLGIFKRLVDPSDENRNNTV